MIHRHGMDGFKMHNDLMKGVRNAPQERQE
jgi:hypothetical protein